MRGVIVQQVRRALIYPLLCNYQLALEVWQNVLDNFLSVSNPKSRIQHALLDIIDLFSSEYHLYNVCYMNDLYVWFTTYAEEDSDLKPLAKLVKEKVQGLTKKELALDLEEVDKAAIDYKQ